MATYACFPPTVIHSTIQISPSEALTHISNYLSRSTTDASLLPNAQLTESGPTVGTSAQGGIVMHNLRRVEAGLKGEYLAAVQDDLAAISSGVAPPESTTEASPTKKRKIRDDRALPLRQSQATDENDLLQTDPIESTSQKESAGKASAIGGWQNKDDYEHEQTIDQGEIGPRGNSDAALNHNRAGSNQPPMIENTEVSKEERKRQKKERKKVEQREKEEKRKRMAEEDRRRDFGGEEEMVVARRTVDGRNEEVEDSMKGDTSVQAVSGKEERAKKRKKKRRSDD